MVSGPFKSLYPWKKGLEARLLTGALDKQTKAWKLGPACRLALQRAEFSCRVGAALAVPNLVAL
jgi:hypothetical protein